MKLHYLLLASATMLATPVFASNVKVESDSSFDRSRNGGYEAKSEVSRKDDSGKTTSETETDVSVDDDGDSKSERTTTITHDPKGLMNKTKTKIVDTKKVDDGKTSVMHKKTVNGDVVEDHESKR